MKAVSNAAAAISRAVGTPPVVLGQFALVLASIALGAALRFSEGWLLTFNLFLSIVTYLLLFVIQNTQNRDGAALHAKLDEIIHAQAGARDDLERLEEKDEDAIETLRHGTRS